MAAKTTAVLCVMVASLLLLTQHVVAVRELLGDVPNADSSKGSKKDGISISIGGGHVSISGSVHIGGKDKPKHGGKEMPSYGQPHP